MKLTGNRCLCQACGRYFNSVSAFDRHRVGSGAKIQCVDPAQLGMILNAHGFWITEPMKTVPAYLAKDSP